MSAYPLYQITHIDLSAFSAAPPTLGWQGNYLVFWWRSLVLGHLFLRPDESLTAKNYYAALAVAIGPAVEHYAAQSLLDSAFWQVWLT